MPERSAPAGEISLARLAAYGQMVVPLAVVGLPLAIYIPPFYGGTLGLDLALIGTLLMLARFSDVVTDPLIGRLSDLTRTRWGRRRPWILAGLPVMVISAYMLFLPPEGAGALYLLGAIVALYFGFTLIVIPYGAWGAELVGGYEERSKVTGSREIFLVAGILLALLVPVLATEAVETSGTGQAVTREAMASLGWLTVILVPLCGFVLLAFVGEPPARLDVPGAAKTAAPAEMLRQIRPLLKNGPFRIVLLSSVCGALAGSVNASVAILFYDHVAGIGEEGLVLILVLFTAALAGTPLWVRLGARLGKHKAIALAGLINMGAFAIIPFIIYGLKPLDAGYVLPAMFAVTIVRGATMSASGVLGMSILADVADLDTLKTGEQRTGFLFSFLGMVRKIFEAAGVGIALPIVSWFGFNPGLEENSQAALFSLLAMYCLLPLLLWLASIAIIWRYPISPARQERLRRALRLKEARRALHSAAS